MSEKKISKSVWIPAELDAELKQCDNQSETIREALEFYFDKSRFWRNKINEKKRKIEYLEFQIQLAKESIQLYEEKLDQMEGINNEKG